MKRLNCPINTLQCIVAIKYIHVRYKNFIPNFLLGKNFLRAAQMNMNFATWGRLMMSVLPPCSGALTSMSPPLASTDLPSPPLPQKPDLTSPPPAEKTSTSTPPPAEWVQSPVLTFKCLFAFILTGMAKCNTILIFCHKHLTPPYNCAVQCMNTDPLGLWNWLKCFLILETQQSSNWTSARSDLPNPLVSTWRRQRARCPW